MAPGRYLRLYVAFARFALAGEMAFRLNFLIKLVVEALWLGMLVMFYNLLFDNTKEIAGWDRESYLFFVGCHYALGGLVETLFLENCTNFAELIRKGDLDHYLLKPIDEQFLITCKHVDWSTLPNVVQGIGVMVYALMVKESWVFSWVNFGLFLVLFACGCAMTYSFLLMLSSLSVWLIRNQSLMEMWWLFTTLMRYPREIFRGSWASPMGLFFTFIVPVLLVINVPAGVMVEKLENPWFVGLTFAATAALIVLSRAFFRRALRAYRSASS